MTLGPIPVPKLVDVNQLRSHSPAIALKLKGKETEISFDRMVDLVLDAQNFLLTHGVRTGSKVIIDLSHPLEDLIVFLALSYLGVGVYRPLGSSVADEKVIQSIGARYLICDSTSSAISFPSGSMHIEIKEMKNPDSNQSPAQNPDQSSMPGAARIDDPRTLELPWLVRSSSGTTGIPKIFITNRHDMMSRRERYYDATDISADDRFYSLTPARFGAARQRVFYALTAGASVLVCDESDTIEAQVELINRSGVTHLYCVPMHLEILCLYAEKRTASKGTPLFPNLKSLETTSSLVTPVLRARVMKLLTPHFVIAYSVSEVGHISSTRKSRRRDLHLNDIGVPVNGIEMGIYDELGKKLPPGQTGRIGIKIADGNFDGYLQGGTGNSGEDRDESGAQQETFFPGDLGYISELGNLIFQGRADDLMIYNGINIYPHEIETSLKSLPGIVDAAAFPLPSALHYQVPCAAVIADSGIREEDLLILCRNLLGSRAPRFLFALNEFPRNSMGKILRKELQKMAIEKINCSAADDAANTPANASANNATDTTNQ